MGKKNGGNQLRLPPQARTEKGRLSPEPEGSRGKGGVIALDRGKAQDDRVYGLADGFLI
jgi:hypothetical protein